MRLGLVVPNTGDQDKFLTVPTMDICSWAFNSGAGGWTGAGGMNQPSTVEATLLGANAGHLTLPPLVGPTSGTPLTNSGTGQTTSPLAPNGTTSATTMTLTDVANGVWDSLFTTCFTVVATYRPNCILRIAHESYGTWYPWGGPALASECVAAYQHLVTLARGVSSSFQFEWCGALNWPAINAGAGYDPMTGGGYPGDSYVDFISADIYDYLSSGGSVSSGSPGTGGNFTAYLPYVGEGLAFAKLHNKPYCWSEFGPNFYGDNPLFIQQAYAWARANSASMGWILVFQDEEGDWTEALGPNTPQSTAVFTQLFGAWARELQGQLSYRFATTGSNRLRA